MKNNRVVVAVIVAPLAGGPAEASEAKYKCDSASVCLSDQQIVAHVKHVELDTTKIHTRACTYDFEKPNVPDCIRTTASGKLFVSPKYRRDLRFDASGLVALYADGLGWVYVNRTGKVVVTGVAPFDNWADEFHSGLVRVLRSDKFGFADRAGKLVIPAVYDGAFQFENGRAVVCKECRTECDKDHEHCWFVGGSWSRINTRGQVIAQCSNDYCR